MPATGAVRMLALSDDRRATQAKDVPTIAESGFPGFRGVSWNGMMAPAKTPREIIDRVANEFIKATKDPQFIAQLDKYGAVAGQPTRPSSSPSSSRRTWRCGRRR